MTTADDERSRLRALAGKKVLVWGFGRHGGGLAAARFCAAQGATVAILDHKDPAAFGPAADAVRAAGWAWHTGDATHPAFAAADLVVASPAVPPRAWPATHPPRTCPEGLFFAHHRGPRMAVTGTKGKSTTANICGALLAWTVGGNSHEPLLDILARAGPDVPLVCELSSFQLWYLAPLRPHFTVALMTSLARDHLDWHPDDAHYRAAKAALLGWADRVAVAPDLEQVALPGAPRLVRPVAVGGFFRPQDPRVFTSHGNDSGAYARREDLALPGDHNARNASLAIAAALHLGVDPALIPERLRQVRGLPHRLETVHHDGPWRYVNDSIATTPEAAIAALDAIDGDIAVILGGSDKGAEFVSLAAAVARRGARPVLFGQTAPRIAQALALYAVSAERAGDFEEAVARARAALPRGGTVLLSPACASFDRFQGFEERGDRFTALARMGVR